MTSCIFASKQSFVFTVKAFVLTPKMTKNSIIFRGGYDKGYKNFIADENLWVLIDPPIIFNFIACIKWGCRSSFHYDLLSATKQSRGNISLGKEWDWEFYSRKRQHPLMMRVGMPPKQSDLDGVFAITYLLSFSSL